MKDTLALEEEDVRAIVSIISGIHAVPGGHLEKKAAMMTGLANLVRADSWAWGMAFQMDPDKPSAHLSMVHGGFSDHAYGLFTQAYNHPGMSAIHAPFAQALADRRCHLTWLRNQIVPDSAYALTDCRDAWLRAGVDDVILSMRPVGPGLFSIIGLYRKPSHSRFTARDQRVAHVTLSGVPWLHAEGWPEQHAVTVRRLTPRQRMTMDLLIQGFSRDEIARHLLISPHTANDYVKAVFRHFGVHSQADLSARFRRGDGGDLP